VLIEVRERANVGEMRAEREWPLARTQYRKLYLDADGGLRDAPVERAASTRYDPLARDERAVFDHCFRDETELTGHMAVKLWVETEDADDMDLFVAVQKLDADGRLVPFVLYALTEIGPVALGWLRVSHRELDARRSRPEQPVHPHTREQRLRPGERVPVEIEIWPSSTRFAAGESLRLIVQGRDIVEPSVPNAPFARHEDTRNRGTHIIHVGGPYDSHLLVPVIRPPGS
jgi:putative CocE/NonD family hydrolase